MPSHDRPAARPPVASLARRFGHAMAMATILLTGPAMAQSNGTQEGAAMMEEELSAPGPLAGTLTLPDADRAAGDDASRAGTIADGAPVVLIVPGSGPTDRDGNSPLGIAAAPYRLLAEALAERGIASVRIDKRGMFGSAKAVPDPNDMTIEGYADDVLAWIEAIGERLPSNGGMRCVVPLGHSEGGLVALAAMGRMSDPCGLVLVAAPGRPPGQTLREQLRVNPANAPILDEAEGAITSLERGERVDEGALHPALAPLFAADVQGFLIDAFGYDPLALVRDIAVPALVVQGGRDLQVGEADARALADAAPNGSLALVPDANHVLKSVDTDDPAANLATYADPAVPVAPEIVDAIEGFLTPLGAPE